MDMIRDILLDIEGGKTTYQLVGPSLAAALDIIPDEPLSQELVDKIELHLKLLASAKYINLQSLSGGYWLVNELTWEGYDLIDSIRDPKIWKATKEGAEKAGGFSADLLKALAKGIVKTQIEKYTGVKLEL